MEKSFSAGAIDNSSSGNRMSVLSCTIYQNYTLHYDLEAWEVGTELFSLLYPLFVVVPLCWNLYYERKNNFLLYVMPRVKLRST